MYLENFYIVNNDFQKKELRLKKIKLKPLSLWKSIILFGIPGLFLFLGLEFGMPWLMGLGLPEIFLFPFFLWVPLILLVPVALLLFKMEKKEQPELSFKERFRLQKPRGKDWLWILGGVIFVFFFDFVVTGPISRWMAGIPFFSPPDHLPLLFNPLKKIQLPLTHLLGVSLKGNWLFLIVTVILHSIALFAEELIWRGFALPRQEVSFGKLAWLVNGLLWAYLIHFFMRWNFISFLPSMLITPFIAQKTKNTWVALLIHGIPNTILWVLIFTGVMGIG